VVGEDEADVVLLGEVVVLGLRVVLADWLALRLALADGLDDGGHRSGGGSGMISQGST
jgi:hypothetical protein